MGAECWALKKENERKLQTTEMRMLQMICGKTLRDDIGNEIICDMTRVEIIEEYLKRAEIAMVCVCGKNG